MTNPETDVLEEHSPLPAVAVQPETPPGEQSPDDIIRYLEQSAQEPGDELSRPGAIVDDGSDPARPFAAAVHSVDSAGYITIYDRRTGQPSTVNRNNIGDTLRKTRCVNRCRGKQCAHPRELVFQHQDPGFRPKEGTWKCRLHPEDSEREKWDEYGLEVCDKGNLQNRFHLQRHMQRKHKDEWAMISSEEWDAEEQARRRKQEERDDALFGLAQGAAAAAAKAAPANPRKAKAS